MEISEKLEIFYQAAIDAALEQSEAIQEECRNVYKDAIDAYEKEKQAGFQTRERKQEEKIRKEVNRDTAQKLMQLKRDYHEKVNLCKMELFALVEEKIMEYRKTKAYKKNLVSMIREAKTLADGEEIKIYLDRTDAPLIAELQSELQEELQTGTGCEMIVSEESFGGGIRIVIPTKNMLLDESFVSRFSEEQAKFSF